MWIHHIGEIMIGVFLALIILHFILHIIFKIQRRNLDNKQTSQKSSNDT